MVASIRKEKDQRIVLAVTNSGFQKGMENSETGSAWIRIRKRKALTYR